MSVIGIGIDVVEIDRIERALARHGRSFEEKIFTSAERIYCRGQRRPAVHFAARFAAKEAIAKALGTGIGERASWQELEVIRRDSGEPQVNLTGQAGLTAQRLGVGLVRVSLTHARDYAAANAILVPAE